MNWRNATDLTWEGRELQGITLSGADWLTYTYNSSGIRTKKVYFNNIESTFTTHSYTLDGSSIIRESVTGPTAYTLDYLYDSSGRVQGFIYNNTYYYFQKNLQGDVVRILNSSGEVVTEYTYDAWGNVLTTTGSLASTVGAYNPFRYRGYYYDSETGFYYLQSRYYDPTVGRFLNADGIVGANGGIEGYNMFAYCNNNPIIFADDNGYIRSYAVTLTDGGGGRSLHNLSATSQQSEKTDEYDYIQDKVIMDYYETCVLDISSYSIEVRYHYQVSDGQIINAELQYFHLTPPIFADAQITFADIVIIDNYFGDKNSALKFIFQVEISYSIGSILAIPDTSPPLIETLFSWPIFSLKNDITHVMYFNFEDK